MKSARVDTKQKLEALVQRMREQERRVRLVEASDVATAARSTTQPATQGPVGKPAAASEQLGKNETETSDVTVESITQQLNTIRAGKSLKDTAVQQEIARYFEGLETSEQEALHAYLKGLAQIVSGQIDAGQAEEPRNHGVETKVTSKKSRQVKPNVVKKLAPKPTPTPGVSSLGAPREDTTPPSVSPIIPKKR